MGGRRSDSMDSDKRARLFREAADEFAAHGLKRASLNRIIRRAGLSKSSFYHFFANKDDLFRQVLEGAVTPFVQGHAQLALSGLTADGFWPAIAAMAREMVLAVNAAPELVAVARMFYRCIETQEDRAATEDVMAGVTAWLDALIRRGQALGQVRDDLPVGLMIDIALGTGMAMDRWMLAHWEDLPPDQRLVLSDRFFHMFHRLFAPAGAVPAAAAAAEAGGGEEEKRP